MLKIEVRHFFYDLIHCKDKILSAFDQWDEKYPDDPRGPLVAGIQESDPGDLVSLLITIQKMALGFQDIQDLITEAEQAQVAADMEDDDDEDDD